MAKRIDTRKLMKREFFAIAGAVAERFLCLACGADTGRLQVFEFGAHCSLDCLENYTGMDR